VLKLFTGVNGFLRHAQGVTERMAGGGWEGTAAENLSCIRDSFISAGMVETPLYTRGNFFPPILPLNRPEKMVGSNRARDGSGGGAALGIHNE